jgi:preprotein translocase subunit YajC
MTSKISEKEKETRNGCIGCIVILIVVVIVACIFTYFGQKNEQQRAQQREQLIEQLRELQIEGMMFVSVAVLTKAYDDNEIAADMNYKGKTFIVDGEVDDIVKGVEGEVSPYVILRASIFNKVGCFFERKDEADLSLLQKGKTVFIKGRCIGKNKEGKITFVNCSVEWNDSDIN